MCTHGTNCRYLACIRYEALHVFRCAGCTDMSFECMTAQTRALCAWLATCWSRARIGVCVVACVLVSVSARRCVCVCVCDFDPPGRLAPKDRCGDRRACCAWRTRNTWGWREEDGGGREEGSDGERDAAPSRRAASVSARAARTRLGALAARVPTTLPRCIFFSASSCHISAGVRMSLVFPQSGGVKFEPSFSSFFLFFPLFSPARAGCPTAIFANRRGSQ